MDSDPLGSLRYFTLKEIILELPDASKHHRHIKVRLDLKDRKLSGGQAPSLNKTDVEILANSGTNTVVIPATDRWPKIKTFRIGNSDGCTLELIVEQKKKLGKISLPGSQSLTFTTNGAEVHHQSKRAGEDERQYEYVLRPETSNISIGAKLRFEVITRDFEHFVQALNVAVKDLIGKESVLDQLGRAGKMFEVAVAIAKPLSELSTASSLIVKGMEIICERLKEQQSFSESIKARLDEIQRLMKTINGGGPIVLKCANLQDIIKDLFAYALDVISFIEDHATEGGKGKVILDLVNLDGATSQVEEFNTRFEKLQIELGLAIGIETLGLTGRSSAITNQHYKDFQAKEDLKVIKAWLSPLDFPEEGVKYREHTAKTGEWFLYSSEFTQWRDGHHTQSGQASPNILWCYGDPGTGKSVMAALAIRYLEDHFHPNMPVLKVFCNHARKQEQTLEKLLQTLWWQIAEEHQSISYNPFDHQAKSRQLTDDEIFAFFLQEITPVQIVYIVVDGLDELDGLVMESLISLITKLPTTCRLLLTSRPLQVIQGDLAQQCSALEIKTENKDLRAFIQHQCYGKPSQLKRVITSSGPDNGQQLYLEIEQTVIAKSTNMFLLAKLHMQVISQQHNAYLIRKELAKLPVGLEAMYQSSLSRIQNLSPSSSELAKRVLVWITYAIKPLTMAALQCAMAIDPTDTEFNEAKLTLQSDLQSVCLGLIRVDGATGLVSLFHKTTREFLTRILPISVDTSHADLARTCLALLSFPSTPNSEDNELLESKYPLFPYAATFWGSHIVACQPEGNSEVVAFLQQPMKVKQSLQMVDGAVWLPSDHKATRQDILGWSGVHVAACFGLVSALQILTEKDPNLPAENGWTPLHVAASCDHADAVSLLLAHPQVDPNKEGQYKFTPLHLASRNGHADVVSLLLAIPGVDLNKQQENGWTSLHLASANGNANVVKILLTSPQVDVDKQQENKWTSLHLASINGHANIVKLLLASSQVNPNTMGESNYTPLLLASRNGHPDVVSILLGNSQVESGIQNINNWNSLHLASDNGHASVVKLLLACSGMDFNQQTSKGSTPLHLASDKNHADVVKLLLANSQVDPDRQEEDSWSPLHLASLKGHSDIVRLLLAKSGVDPNKQGKENLTPLHLASQNGHVDVVSLLLANPNVNPNQKSSRGIPLHVASENGQADVVQLLLADSQVKPDTPDEDNFTPLHLASQYGYANVVKLLLANSNVDPNWQRNRYNTPLHTATVKGHIDVIKLLMANSRVDLNRQTENGITPLHLASYCGHKNIVELLLANPNVDQGRQMDGGKTALQVALETGHTEIAELFKKHDNLVTSTSGFAEMKCATEAET